ncbi:erythromycin esterase family protein, partial [Actinomadura adrarensis]
MQQRIAMRVVAPVAGAVVVFSGAGLTVPSAAAGTTMAAPHTRTDERVVKQWIERNAHRLGSADPSAPLDDLHSLRRSVGDASIVGLGEPAHKLKEVTTLKHRALRYLVERMGFRTIAWEDDWTLGMEVDEYIRTGKGDPEALLKQMDAWDTRECADVLRWLRDFNAGRPESDKVRFFGVEHWYTWTPAYDIVKSYVARAAPALVPELEAHLEPISPVGSRQDHVDWYKDVTPKQPYVDHAQRVYDLVEGLPHRPGDRAYSLAEHAARQIRSFYLTYY